MLLSWSIAGGGDVILGYSRGCCVIFEFLAKVHIFAEALVIICKHFQNATISEILKNEK